MYATLLSDGSVMLFEDDGTTHARVTPPYEFMVIADADGSATIDLTGHGTMPLRFYRIRTVREWVDGAAGEPPEPVAIPPPVVIAPSGPPAFLPPGAKRAEPITSPAPAPTPWRGRRYRHDAGTMQYWLEGFLADIAAGKEKPSGGTQDYWRLQVLHRKYPPAVARIAEASKGEWSIHILGPKRKKGSR